MTKQQSLSSTKVQWEPDQNGHPTAWLTEDLVVDMHKETRLLTIYRPSDWGMMWRNAAGEDVTPLDSLLGVDNPPAGIRQWSRERLLGWVYAQLVTEEIEK
jgi:hypothetical protein